MYLLGAAAYRQGLLGNAGTWRRSPGAADRPKARTWTRAVRILAAALGGGVLLLPGAAVAAATGPHYIGIVIGNRYACVRWHAGITGDDVLNTAARVTYRSDGIVLTVNGRPNPPHADDTHFWSYWHDTGVRWQYSNVGASGYQPKTGTVEGWSFDHGQASAPPPVSNPRGLYASICGARDQPVPSAKPTPTHSTAPARSSSPIRTRSAPSPESSPAAPHSTTPASTATSTGPAATHPTRARASSRAPHRHRPHRTTPATPTLSTSTQPRLRAAAQSLHPLPKPAAASADDGSPVPLLIGAGAVVVIGAGGIWTALRRRRAS
jgi:hypothetical protein